MQKRIKTKKSKVYLQNFKKNRKTKKFTKFEKTYKL
jgi:hypothetical protein